MDEKSTRIKTARAAKAENAVDEKPAAEVNRLRTEIEDARDGLGAYVSELDRRRHEALDLKLQLKKHPGIGIGAGVVAVAAVAGAVAMIVQSRRQQGRTAPWAPWRIAPSVAQKPAQLGKFLLGSAVPIGLKAARGVLERITSRRLRLA